MSLRKVRRHGRRWDSSIVNSLPSGSDAIPHAKHLLGARWSSNTQHYLHLKESLHIWLKKGNKGQSAFQNNCLSNNIYEIPESLQQYGRFGGVDSRQSLNDFC
jgi:hypothetical protein